MMKFDIIARFSGKYDQPQLDLIKNIRDLFARSMQKDDFYWWVESAHQEETGVKPIKLTDDILSYYRLQSSLGDNILRDGVEYILAQISKFHNTRKNNLVSKVGQALLYDTLNDPISLMLHEISRWAVNLSNVDLNDTVKCSEAQEMLKKRTHYFEQLYSLKAIGEYCRGWATDKGQDMTINELVNNINTTLKGEMSVNLLLQKSRLSSREHISSLRTGLCKLIKNALKVAFYVYRDTKNLSDHFTIKDIRDPIVSSEVEAVKTDSGVLLRHMLQTLPFLNLFSSEIKSQKDAADLSIQQRNSENIHDILVDFDSVSLKSIESILLKKNSTSGIHQNFLEEDCLNAYRDLCRIIMMFSVYYQWMGCAYAIAGVGGDIAVYALAREDLEAGIKKFEALIEEYEKNIKTIFDKTKATVAKLDNATPLFSDLNDWYQNYQYANQAKAASSHDLSGIKKALEAISSGLHKPIENLKDALKANLSELRLIGHALGHFQKNLIEGKKEGYIAPCAQAEGNSSIVMAERSAAVSNPLFFGGANAQHTTDQNHNGLSKLQLNVIKRIIARKYSLNTST